MELTFQDFKNLVGISEMFERLFFNVSLFDFLLKPVYRFLQFYSSYFFFYSYLFRVPSTRMASL